MYFNYGLQYDLRDNSFNPKEGYVAFFNQELPLISENNEITNTLNLINYKENKSSEMVGRASLYIKTINTFDGSDVRISKRGNIPYGRLEGLKEVKLAPLMVVII